MNKGWTIRKVMGWGVGVWGGWKTKKEFMQGRVTEKIIMLRSEEHKEEKFLKSE